MLLTPLVTQTLAPSKATPLTGKVPTGNVRERGPIPSSLTRSFVTVLFPEFATQMLTPSNAMPLGSIPTANVPSVAPSLARSWVIVPLWLFETQMLAPSNAIASGLLPTVKHLDYASPFLQRLKRFANDRAEQRSHTGVTAVGAVAERSALAARERLVAAARAESPGPQVLFSQLPPSL